LLGEALVVTAFFYDTAAVRDFLVRGEAARLA